MWFRLLSIGDFALNPALPASQASWQYGEPGKLSSGPQQSVDNKSDDQNGGSRTDKDRKQSVVHMRLHYELYHRHVPLVRRYSSNAAK